MNISFNQIERLPLFPQEHFQILIASNNRITDIKETGSKTIISLNLEKNKIKEIDGLDHFSNLHTVNLKNNKIKTTEQYIIIYIL